MICIIIIIIIVTPGPAKEDEIFIKVRSIEQRKYSQQIEYCSKDAVTEDMVKVKESNGSEEAVANLDQTMQQLQHHVYCLGTL